MAGPPKRFAQGIGLAFSLTALGLTLVGEWGAAEIVLGLLATAALLESVLGLCLGCKAFALLIRLGVVPEAVWRGAQHMGHALTETPLDIDVSSHYHM